MNCHGPVAGFDGCDVLQLCCISATHSSLLLDSFPFPCHVNINMPDLCLPFVFCLSYFVALLFFLSCLVLGWLNVYICVFTHICMCIHVTYTCVCVTYTHHIFWYSILIFLLTLCVYLFALLFNSLKDVSYCRMFSVNFVTFYIKCKNFIIVNSLYLPLSCCHYSCYVCVL